MGKKNWYKANFSYFVAKIDFFTAPYDFDYIDKVNKSTANANARITLQGFIRAKGIEEDCCSE